MNYNSLRDDSSRGIFLVALIIVVFIPPSFFYFGLASSMAEGTLIAVIAVISLLLMTGRGTLPVFSKALGWAIVILITIAFHSLVVRLKMPFDFYRASLSLCLFQILFLGSLGLSHLLSESSDSSIHSSVRYIFCIFIILAIGNLLDITPTAPVGVTYAKPFFPYTEPSFLALVLIPLLLFQVVVSSGKKRLLLISFSFVASFSLQSLTLLIGSIVISIICLNPISIALVTPVLYILNPLFNLEYYTDRFIFSGDTQNLSTLVYMQGWQLVADGFLKSDGWGIGFQQLGVHETKTTAGITIVTLVGNDVNILDGGFTAAKVLSEFGILGGLLLIGYFFTAFRAFTFLRRALSCPTNYPAALIFTNSIVIGYGIELMIRGSGYFTGTGLLYLASLVYLYSGRGKQNIGLRKIALDSRGATNPS